MTVSAIEPEVILAGDGLNKVFTFNFPMGPSSSVVVRLIDQTLVAEEVDPSEYSLTHDAQGGSVTFNDAPPSGLRVAITRTTTIDQRVSVTAQTAYDPKVVEGVWDKLTLHAQEARKALETVIQGPPGSDPVDTYNVLTQAKEDAETAADNAAGWGDKAREWAEGAGEPGDPGSQSAKSWADEARQDRVQTGQDRVRTGQDRTTARNNRVASEAARDKAREWAEGAGEPGGPETASAKTWAMAARTSYASRAEAQSAMVPQAITVLQVTHVGQLYQYNRDPSGTALQTADGAWWSPAPPVSHRHWGYGNSFTLTPVDDYNAILRAYDGTGTVTLADGSYELGAFTLRNGKLLNLTAQNIGGATLVANFTFESGSRFRGSGFDITPSKLSDTWIRSYLAYVDFTDCVIDGTNSSASLFGSVNGGVFRFVASARTTKIIFGGSVSEGIDFDSGASVKIGGNPGAGRKVEFTLDAATNAATPFLLVFDNSSGMLSAIRFRGGALGKTGTGIVARRNSRITVQAAGADAPDVNEFINIRYAIRAFQGSSVVLQKVKFEDCFEGLRSDTGGLFRYAAGDLIFDAVDTPMRTGSPMVYYP